MDAHYHAGTHAVPFGIPNGKPNGYILEEVGPSLKQSPPVNCSNGDVLAEVRTPAELEVSGIPMREGPCELEPTSP